jgi:hypothetical protein
MLGQQQTLEPELQVLALDVAAERDVVARPPVVGGVGSVSQNDPAVHVAADALVQTWSATAPETSVEVVLHDIDVLDEPTAPFPNHLEQQRPQQTMVQNVRIGDGIGWNTGNSRNELEIGDGIGWNPVNSRNELDL